MTEPEKTQPDESLAWVASDDAVRKLLLSTWQRARLDWSRTSSALSETFRTHKLGRRERGAISEVLYGMIRHLRRIDESLDRGGLRSRSTAPDAARLLAYLVLEEGLSANVAAQHEPAIDWDAVAGHDAELASLKSPVQRLARRHSLPDWLAARLQSELGDDAEPLARALASRAPMTVRVNSLRASREEVQASLAEAGVETHPGALSPWALHFETRINIFSTPEFKAGAIEAQDEGSQLLAEVVAPPPKGVVVDLCAGAGGKTLALAALMENRGRIVSTDIYQHKLDELRRRCRRGGADNVQAVLIDSDPQAAWPPALERLVGKVDRVLVDAPCSGIGSLRRNPEARWRLSEAELERMPALQLSIAERGLSLLADGGRLVYATCTLLAAENEGVVDQLLARHPELERVPLKEIWGRERAESVGDGVILETLPHVHGCDGFFAAVLRKRRR